ncbi:MAG: hypothetical protein HQK49_03100 [Oligoflexia bacterium]|nr:hypothetical protein [Oligoflexia bacterium]
MFTKKSSNFYLKTLSCILLLTVIIISSCQQNSGKNSSKRGPANIIPVKNEFVITIDGKEVSKEERVNQFLNKPRYNQDRRADFIDERGNIKERF